MLQIIAHDFFDVPLPEMKDFDPATVSIKINYCNVKYWGGIKIILMHWFSVNE